MKFQNIPIRTENGRLFRKAFTRPVPLDVDYATSELRILAMSNDDDLIQTLLKAPDRQLDARMKPLIEKWDKPAKAIQILEVLDHCVNGSLASGVVVRLFEILLGGAIKREETTYEAVVAQATWRKP